MSAVETGTGLRMLRRTKGDPPGAEAKAVAANWRVLANVIYGAEGVEVCPP